MTQAQHTLLLGALKSAISAAAGMVLGLNIVDPEHFNVMTFGGWKHIGMAVLISVLVAEARFWQQWANSGTAVVLTPGAPANGNH